MYLNCLQSIPCFLGSGPLKEWVTLEGDVDKPPIIRMARPLSGLRHEGTRKRRRASMRDDVWSVGDRVDAWIQERYCLQFSLFAKK